MTQLLLTCNILAFKLNNQLKGNLTMVFEEIVNESLRSLNLEGISLKNKIPLTLANLHSYVLLFLGCKLATILKLQSYPSKEN